MLRVLQRMSNHRPSRFERLADIVLACAIGLAGAWWLVTWMTE